MAHVSTLITPYGMPIPVFALGASQNVAYNAAGGASTESTAFGASTIAVLVSTTTSDVRISIGKRGSNSASSTTTLIPKPAIIVFQVPSGGSVAVLGNDTNTGSISVTELVSSTQ